MDDCTRLPYKECPTRHSLIQIESDRDLMDARNTIAMPKTCDALVTLISSSISPVLQKQTRRLTRLSASERRRRVRPMQLVVRATSSGAHGFGSGGPNMVDANMIVLRKRMFDLKTQETNSKTPEAYMEWEKELYGTYNVFRAMKCLQAALINTRPSVAITILTFICLSVFFMVLFVSANAVSYLIQFTTAFLRNMHG